MGEAGDNIMNPKDRIQETLRLEFWNFAPTLTVLLNRREKNEREEHTG